MIVAQVLLWNELRQFKQETKLHIKQLEQNVSKLSNNNKGQFHFIAMTKATANKGCTNDTSECTAKATGKKCSTETLPKEKQVSHPHACTY